MYLLKYHYKTNVLMAFVALMALSAGSCTQGDEPAPSDGAASVMFDAYISNAVESRAYIADLKGLKQTGFGVFAIKTGEADFNPDATEGVTPGFMYNHKVRWDATDVGKWVCQRDMSWPAGKVSFFAYAPYTATFAATGITGITGSDVSGSPKLTFVTDSDVDRQIDLLYADTGKTIDLVASRQAVRFTMKHALARIGFRCGMDNAVDAGTSVTVTGVSLQSSALGGSGTLNLYTGKWEDIKAADMKYTLGTDDFIAGSNEIVKAGATKTANLTANGKYLMIIPSDKAVPVTITVKYDVVTTDSSLAGGSIKISNEISKTLDFNFETGKAYRLTLTLGMNSVDISAGIMGWDEIEEGWTPVEK